MKKIFKSIITTALLLPTLALAVNAFMPFQGGTGTQVKPTYGQVLVGTANGVYAPMATSSLGLSSWATTSTNYWATTYGGLLTASDLTVSGTATTSTLCFVGDGCMTSIAQAVSSKTSMYFWNGVSDLVGYEQFRTYPDSSGVNVDESCSADADIAGGYCNIDSYVSTTTDLAVNAISAGTWSFNYFTYLNSGVGNSKLEATVYRRVGTVETMLFQATSTDISSTVLTKNNLLSVQPSFTFATTDRLVVKVKGWTDSTTAKVVHFLYGGIGQSYSYVETPISTGDFNFARKDLNEPITGTWTFSVPPILSSLAVPAGSFLAVSPTGAIIATTSPTTYGDTNVNAYIHASTTIPKLYTSNTWTALQTFVTGIFTTLTTNGTASSTSLFVSDQSLTLGGGKIYKIQHDRFGIPQATTTDETAKFGTVLSPTESITLVSIDMQISSTTQPSDFSNNGITFNLNIANVMSSTSPLTAFTTLQWMHGTSSTLSFTPNSTIVVPAGWSYWFTFGTASTSQIQMLNANINYYEN